MSYPSQSRYPPNSSAVDDVMNGNIKNIMSKMRFLPKGPLAVPLTTTTILQRSSLASFRTGGGRDLNAVLTNTKDS
jgi:hypothetical protein